MPVTKPPIVPLRPGEPSLTTTPGSGVAQRRLNTTVRPGAKNFAALGVVPRGTMHADKRIVPPLQPNASPRQIVDRTAPAQASTSRTRNAHAVSPAPSGPSGTVRLRPLQTAGFTNSALAPSGPVGGLNQDSHAIPIMLHGVQPKGSTA